MRHWNVLAAFGLIALSACQAHRGQSAAPLEKAPAPEAPAAASPTAEVAVPAAPLWQVRENDVRCIQAPCPTLDALPVDPPGELQRVTGLDLSSLGLTAKQVEAVMGEVHGAGLSVRGVVEERPDARGRLHKVLRAQSLASR